MPPTRPFWARHGFFRSAPEHLHLHDLASVNPNLRPLSNNLSREHQILQQLLVHARQRPASGPLLRRPGSLFRLADDTALCGEKNVALRELLLEFTDQAGLDFVEVFEEGRGDVDEDGTLAVPNVELLSKVSRARRCAVCVD